MTLPGYAVRHPVTTFMSFLAVVLIGAFCLWHFSIDQLPNMDIPALTVLTVYEGAAPEDVESKVTKVLEDALAAIPDVKHIVSTSSENLSKITLSFEWQTHLDTRANDARDAIDKVRHRLPEGVDPPRVLKINMADFPILVLGVRARESFPRLEKLLEDAVTDDLKRIPGVALALTMTPLRREVNVTVDRQRLAAHGLTVEDVARVIAAENRDIPAGTVKSGDDDYLVRLQGEFRDIDALRQIIVATRNGGVVRLGDVAVVEDGFREPTEYVTVDGEPGAAIVIRKQSGANTVEVARRVKARLRELASRLPSDVTIIPVVDASRDIERMIRDLTQTLWQGALMAMAVVLVFLRRWRASLIIALVIPFSLLLALVGMFFLGYTINMMTLFGLIIVVGMVVDNAIVVLENITRHRELGERPRAAAIFGADEVALSISAATLTTVCIFFPILFIKGVTRIFFAQFAVVASIALVGSLFSALTLTPMLTAVLLQDPSANEGAAGRFFRWTERQFRRVEEGYARLLGWALGHRGAVLAALGVLLAATAGVGARLGGEFMPREDRNAVRGVVRLPVGTRVEKTAEVMRALDARIREIVPPEEREAVFTRCGASGGGMTALIGEEAPHVGSFSIRLTPRDRRRRRDVEIAAALRDEIAARRSEWNIQRFELETTDLLAGLVLGGERPLTFNVMGSNLEQIAQAAREVADIARRTPGAVDISLSLDEGRPEWSIEPDRARAARFGLNASAIGAAARSAFHGVVAAPYRVGGDEYDIRVRYAEPNRRTREDIAALPLRLPGGGWVRLDQVAEIRPRFGPVKIDRKDQTRVINVAGDVAGRPLGAVVSEIESAARRMSLPEGVQIQAAGQAEDMRESFFWLSLALALGTALVYMVMASQFESLRGPFVVMFSIPFTFTGVVAALWARGYHLNVVVFLGLLMLIGTVVNNAIVLVDYTNILQARGLPMREAVREAGRTRLRPVLMTALTTIVALLPMALRRGQGAEVWNPLGTTVAAGLFVSTLVTLVLVPVMYTLLMRDRVGNAGRRTGETEPRGVSAAS